MKQRMYFEEEELASLAKKFRESSGRTRAQASRDMGVKHPSIFHAEESPAAPYTKLRRRMIEAYGNAKVSGPLFRLEKKR